MGLKVIYKRNFSQKTIHSSIIFYDIWTNWLWMIWLYLIVELFNLDKMQCNLLRFVSFCIIEVSNWQEHHFKSPRASIKLFSFSILRKPKKLKIWRIPKRLTSPPSTCWLYFTDILHQTVTEPGWFVLIELVGYISPKRIVLISSPEPVSPRMATPAPGKEESSTKQTPPIPNAVIDRSSGEQQDGKQWGYDLYPERRGEKYKPSWGRVLLGMEGTENLDKIKCERNVYKCVKNSPMVKLMMGALKSSGW